MSLIDWLDPDDPLLTSDCPDAPLHAMMKASRVAAMHGAKSKPCANGKADDRPTGNCFECDRQDVKLYSHRCAGCAAAKYM